LFPTRKSQYNQRNERLAAMDAPNPSSAVTFANRTPLRIGAVGLKARDLSRLTDFYTDAIGLQVIDRDAKTARLGAGGVTLLALEAAPNALPDDPRTAGLFHTAFLQPTRADLARWLVHAANTRVALSGASDHLVSEAIYLDDPEGNGIEVYRDRLPEEWRWSGDRIQMATDRLDLDNLAADAGNMAYAGAPGGLRIGHIHLRVGDLAATQKFYCDVVGLNPTAGRGGALFMSSGRYHHHVGSNIWHSAGAGTRDDDRAGLSWFAIEAADGAERDAAIKRLRDANVPLANGQNGAEARDPFGTRLRLTS
jgi:catechol 2,3-dioxygenase